jgi:hypothetical protein|tara:strand:+ start:20035 stop:20292 length:258 start_codon:yes stop_codon:yes gene_type:complete
MQTLLPTLTIEKFLLSDFGFLTSELKEMNRSGREPVSIDVETGTMEPNDVPVVVLKNVKITEHGLEVIRPDAKSPEAPAPEIGMP